MKAGRYFLAQDDDCHWFLVEADKRTEWEAWAQLDGENVLAWDPPSFAERIDGDPSRIVFSNPEEVKP